MGYSWRGFERWCCQCGRRFYAKSERKQECSPRCKMAAWRAVKMLEGTHGWNGPRRRFARVQPA